jgi:hypothetical protein
LGHDGSEGQVPCCEDDRETYSSCVSTGGFLVTLLSPI